MIPAYFVSEPSTPRTRPPSSPPSPLRPLPKIAFDASRTAIVVTVRAADLAIVSPSVSLRRAGALGSGVGVGAWESRSRGCGLGVSADAGARPHGDGDPVGAVGGAATGGGIASYWPRRR